MTQRTGPRWRLGVAVLAVVLIPAALLLLLQASLACGCSSGVSSPIDGVVVKVEATGLATVQAFTLRPNSGGASIRFTIGPLENATQFPPGHLKEHQASGSAVRVYFVRNGQDFVAYRLEDAPVASSSP
jgi:hypothetical protein